MENIGTIELEGMEFKAYHGCLEQEKVRGNSFTVDFHGELDLSAAAEPIPQAICSISKQTEHLLFKNIIPQRIVMKRYRGHLNITLAITNWDLLKWN